MSSLIRRFFKHSQNSWESLEKSAFSILILLLALFTVSFAIESDNAPQSIAISSQKPVDLSVTEPFESTEIVPLLPRHFRIRLQYGESLTHLFARLKLETGEIDRLLKGVNHQHRRALSRLPRNTFLYVTLNSDDALKELVVMEDGVHGTSYRALKDGSYKVSEYVAQYSTHHHYLGGDITSSLYRDGLAIGMSDALVITFAEVFAYDIDFANDVRKQDEFSMLLEEVLVENRTVQKDTIALARFVNRGKEIIGIRYTNKNGQTGYFTPSGESLRTRFLRMPVKFSRISSGFNLRRKHPILKIVRAHKGTDFAARPGTPINAAGNGRLTFVGYKGGYGKTIIIDHGDGYTTLYAHMRGYASGMRKGRRVKQGDVIGYVGSTGVSTGPHLHYEFRIKGVHHNPLTVKMARRTKLHKSELPAFRRHAEKLIALHNDRRRELAQQDQLSQE